MLRQENRVRTSADFTNIVRSGARTGRRNLVFYALTGNSFEPSRFGFIVSKAVGNAVVRNLVKRRLRKCAADVLAAQPEGLMVVARALPASAAASWVELSSDYASAAAAAVSRRGQHGSGRG